VKISSKSGNLIVGILHQLGFSRHIEISCHLSVFTAHSKNTKHRRRRGTTTMNAEKADSNDNHRDKLRDGPCAKPYFDLEDCAADKIVRSHRVSRRRMCRRRWRRLECCLQVLMLWCRRRLASSRPFESMRRQPTFYFMLKKKGCADIMCLIGSTL
jgi:hypothetical protein